MPIIYKHGDITKSGAHAIFHGCNCFCTMGTGVALALRNKWPAVYEADLKTKRGDKQKLGTFSVAINKNWPLVYNLYTQYAYGREKRQLDYEALACALWALKYELELRDPDKTWKVAGSRIGCNNAGGDWKIVSSMIEEIFDDRTIEIWSK